MKRIIQAASLLLTMLLAGCGTFWAGHAVEQQRHGTSSSLVDYLYPDGEMPPEYTEQLPYLELPLRVGIAFVPSDNQADLSAVTKQELLTRVASAFEGRPFVSDIAIISDVYLRSARGLIGMRQVARMHDVDVMALVSYDQLSISGERDSAVLYWTIVGAFVVKGNTNEVQTMVDTAVFDTSSGRLLLRAPGLHSGDANTTMIDNARDLRKLQHAGFSDATDAMIANLGDELESFRNDVKQGERAQVAWTNGGGGSSGILLVALLMFLLSLRRIVAREHDQLSVSSRIPIQSGDVGPASTKHCHWLQH
jgi:rhombotail lipoprotein